MSHSRPLFCIFRSYETNFRIETLYFSGIRTWIVIEEGEHADHLTTPLPNFADFMFIKVLCYQMQVYQKSYILVQLRQKKERADCCPSRMSRQIWCQDTCQHSPLTRRSSGSDTKSELYLLQGETLAPILVTIMIPSTNYVG